MKVQIFGYNWEDIKRAQQGGSLTGPLVKSMPSVACLTCGKYFKPEQPAFPVSCKHCGRIHWESEAISSNWPKLV